MLALIRTVTRLIELLFVLPARVLRALTIGIAFNPNLGPLRYLAAAALLYVAFAATLVYVIAPVRGYIGSQYMAEKLHYDSERWLATAIYDGSRDFVGTFDPRLDSVRDVNFTGEAIEFGSYTANPDHKSIPVQEIPEDYWRCVVYHEDRYLGGWSNPFGIDFLGVLKIPYSSLKRSLRSGGIRLGVGGSTLPMQLARVIYKTPPRRGEGPLEKLRRKIREWWLAPVIFHTLTRSDNNRQLKEWVSNHLWLAQRTGGAPLHGVEVTSRIIFGKEARQLSTAEQFVLASAVNKPIILLEGSEQLNRVRLDRWRYIAEVRARHCAETLIEDPEKQRKVLFDLVSMAGGPPDPRIDADLKVPLERYAAKLADRARANPIIRANVLMPSARYGLREEMKLDFGFQWRNSIRSVSTTLDVSENLSFHAAIRAELAKLNKKWKSQLNPGYTLDPEVARQTGGFEMPNVVVVAADAKGQIVRYFENSGLAPYYGSAIARSAKTGHYIPAREPRQIASTGKVLAAIAIANERRDGLQALYVDRNAPERGLETCARNGSLRRGRKAIVAFACSLNGPVEWRAARAGQPAMARLIKAFGYNMPPAPSSETETPASTAAVRGLISGSPRRVHQMSAIVLAALTGRGSKPVAPPTLIKRFEYANDEAREEHTKRSQHMVKPNQVIRSDSHALLRAFLRAPLCYRANRRHHGTLKDLRKWCAQLRRGVRLHVAKTGTSVTSDADSTVDAWVTGGIQFTNGAAYSYVVVVGTGSAAKPFAHRLHSSQLAAPLVNALLLSLERSARGSEIVVANAPSATPRARTRPARNRSAARRKAVTQRDLVREILERQMGSGN